MMNMEKYFTKIDLENAYNTYYGNGVMFNDYFEDLGKYGEIGHEMFSKEDVENILTKFIEENSSTPSIDISLVADFIEDYVKNYDNKTSIIEEEFFVTYGMIKSTCGWSKWCDVTDSNHYAINEWGDYSIDTLFKCTKSQFEKLFN